MYEIVMTWKFMSGYWLKYPCVGRLKTSGLVNFLLLPNLIFQNYYF